MIKEAISTLVSGKSLTFEEAADATRAAGWEKIRNEGDTGGEVEKNYA